MPENLRVLTQNLVLNKVNATVIPAAVHTADRRILMELSNLDYGHKIATSAPVGSTCEVDCMTIPTMIRRLGWEKIDLLKMDIEGHEKALLSGDCSWLSKVGSITGSICIECHEESSIKDLEKVTKSFGFRPPTNLPGIWLVMR